MNLVVIVYILCAGLPFGRLENLAPFAPFGVRGIFGAASVIFFALALTPLHVQPKRCVACLP